MDKTTVERECASEQQLLVFLMRISNSKASIYCLRLEEE